MTVRRWQRLGSPRSRSGAWMGAVVVVAFMLALLDLGAMPAAAALSSPVATGLKPVAMWSAGDSYSSGEGIEGTGAGDDTCAQSLLAYGPRARDLLVSQRSWQIPGVGFAFTACTGATVVDLFDGDRTANHGTGTQGSKVKGKFDVVTVSIGGNNLGFADIVSACTGFADVASTWSSVVGTRGAGSPCGVDFDSSTSAQTSIKTRIDDLAKGKSFVSPPSITPLAGLYQRIVTDSLNPGGRLVVVGYPRLFASTEEWGGWRGGVCNLVHADDAEMLGRAADYFDQTIRRAVQDANSRLGGDRVDFVSMLDAFHANGVSHELCAQRVEYLNSVAIAFWDGSLRKEHMFHPNSTGHQVLAELVAGDLDARMTASLAPAAAPAAPKPSSATPAAPATPAATVPAPTRLSDGTSVYDIGEAFDHSCVVAWPTAPVTTKTTIQMTMSCQGLPARYPLVSVVYGDPQLPINPMTGNVRVQGHVVDVATSAMGFQMLVIQADSITW